MVRFQILTIDLILFRCIIFVSCWSASSGLNKRLHIQKLAGIIGGVYQCGEWLVILTFNSLCLVFFFATNLCNPYLSDKMDMSIFPDSLPIKLPQAPKKNISYRSSLRSLKTVSNTIPQVSQGSTFKRYRSKRQIRTRGALRFGTAESWLPRD